MNQKPRAATAGLSNKTCECCLARIKNQKDYLICDDCVALNNFINSNWKKSNGLRQH